MSITAITCTGDRPAPFSLCVGYMARQTRRPDRWIIVDDGKVPTVPAGDWLQQFCEIDEVQVIRRVPAVMDPPHTLAVNLLAALDRVATPRVAFIEDDDWYGAKHIEILDEELKAHEMVGFQGIVYYHVGQRCYRTMGESSPHSSLCQTGITRNVLPALKRICSRIDTPFIDLRLWTEFHPGKKLAKNIHTVVGIKGLPGRPGLTAGWRNTHGYTPDPHLHFLANLIGADVKHYSDLARFPRPVPGRS